MRKTRLLLAAAVAGFLALFIAAPAFAASYSEPVINPTGGSGADGVVEPGEDFTITGDFGGTECDPWTAEFEGQTDAGSGTTFEVSFSAPEEPGEYEILMTCVWDETAGAVASGSTAVIPFAATTTLSIPITVAADDDSAGDGDDADSDEEGALPDTGGSNVLLVAGGAALVVAGAGLIAARRRTN